MKKFAVIFLLLSGCVTLNKVSDVDINPDFTHNEVQRIAVVRFESPVDNKKEEDDSNTLTNSNAGSILASLISKELAKWGRYVVVSRRALEEELKLKDLKEKEFLELGNYSGLGNALGVDAVVIGNVEDFGISYRSLSSGLILSLVTRVSFTARCIDVATNETIWSIQVAGNSKKDNESALASQLITQTIEKLMAEIDQ